MLSIAKFLEKMVQKNEETKAKKLVSYAPKVKY